MARLRKHDRVYTGNFGFATVYSMRRNSEGEILVMPDDASSAYRANRARGTSELGAVVTVPLSFCTKLTLESEQFLSEAGAIDYRFKSLVIDLLNSGHSVNRIRRLFLDVAQIRLYEKS